MDRYTNGIVTTPINVADLSQLLNRSQENINKVEYSNLLTSVGGLCTHPNINMLSLYKPTEYKGLVTDDNKKDAQVLGVAYSFAGYLYGYNCYGITKPHWTKRISVMPTDETKPLANNGIDMTIITQNKKWTYNTPTMFRLSDFTNYAHRRLIYPFLGSATPYSCSISAYQKEANTLNIGVTIRCNLDDVTSGNAKQMGLLTLMGEKEDNSTYLGVLCYMPPDTSINANRTTPYLWFKKGQKLGEVGDSGDARMPNIFADFSLVDDNENRIVIAGEKAYIIPVLVKSSAYDYYFIPLALNGAEYREYEIQDTGITTNNVYISTVRAAITVIRADDTYTIYFNSASDLTFVFANINNALGSTIRQQGKSAIMPADGTSYVEKINNAYWGAFDEDSGTYQATIKTTSINAQAFSGDDGSLFDTATNPANRPFTLVVRNSSDSFKVGFRHTYLEGLQTPVSINLDFTINKGDIQNNSTKRYTETYTKQQL